MSYSKEQIARDVRFVNGTPEGERVIGYLLDFCHVYHTTMHPDGDSHKTAFNEGQRSVGLELIALLVREPDQFKAETARRLAAQIEGD